MATTGEKLVELSTLSTGTALEHLLAIETGGGAGGTVYLDRILATVTPELAGAVNAQISAVVDDGIEAELDDGIEAELDDDIKGVVE